VCLQIDRLVTGFVIGLLVPISLAWAQYVHPLNLPRMPQLEQIPSDYLFNIPLENALEELEQDSEWIELKEEAYHSDYQAQSTNLNDLNNSFEDFRMSDEFKNAKISISSNQLEKAVHKPFSKSSDPELDHNFALTNLIKSSLQHTTTTPINNSIDANWIESSLQEDISGKIKTYPSHPSIFNRNSSVKYIENHGMTSGKASHKQTTETLSYNEVLASYPVYSGITSSTPSVYYNIFESETLESFSSENSSPETTYAINSRQRRVLHTYVWEMTDFANYTKYDGVGVDNDYLDLGNWTDGDTLKIILNPLSSGSVTVGTAENGSATQGVASNMPVFPDSGIWSESTRTYNDFMKITGAYAPSPSSITVDASAMKYYMNWYYGDWSIETGSSEHYNLVYYSAVPEPSTYFMIGALFCFIGCNRSSRNTIKTFLSKAFMHWKTKAHIEDVQDRIS
jgi:hypothetical protein